MSRGPGHPKLQHFRIFKEAPAEENFLKSIERRSSLRIQTSTRYAQCFKQLKIHFLTSDKKGGINV